MSSKLPPPGAGVPDVIQRGLAVLFVGINPGRMSAERRAHFANPANAFWRLLHESRFTPSRLHPNDTRDLLAHGLGVTNVVARWTPGTKELGKDDFATGRSELARKLARYRPRAIVFVGITAYRAFSDLGAAPLQCGEQSERIAGARVFVVPNPSGRNAHYSYREMLRIYRSVAHALAIGGG